MGLVSKFVDWLGLLSNIFESQHDAKRSTNPLNHSPLHHNHHLILRLLVDSR
jgi:hypothetical protein